MKNTPGAAIGDPDPLSVPRRGIGGPNRPRPSRSLRNNFRILLRRNANKRDLRPIRREFGRSVMIEAWTHPYYFLGGEFVDSDQSVAASIADERNPFAIRGPSEGGNMTLVDNQRLRCGFANACSQ